MSSDGGPEHDNPRLQGPAVVGPAGEPLTRLASAPWAGTEIDSTHTPLICTGILGQPDQLVEVRHRLERWAIGAGLGAAAVADLVLASYEALANAAEHAYPPAEDGLVDLAAARTTGGRILVIVTDHGTWRPPPADQGFRGRGLQMIMALSHRAQVTPGPRGTTVHMEWKV
ncbi:MAG TPA: ATP-binding protein [Pseudonocardiaceae bacterium]|nr:ATP-binding protein [Pseudonocardiaceae bacterium]